MSENTTATLDLSAMLAEATLPDIAPGVATYCKEQLAFFAKSNRNRRTITMSAAMAPAILANRPDLVDSLEGSELATAVAKEFARQVKLYADEHGLNCYPKRSGATVSFRFSKPSDNDADE